MDPDADFRPSRSRGGGGGGGGGLSSTSSQSHRDVSQQVALPNSSRRAANRRAARSGGDGRGGPSASSSDHHHDRQQQQQQQQHRHQRKSSSRGRVGDNRSVASSSHYSTAAASSAKAEGGGGRDGRRRRGGGGGGGDEESGSSRAVCSSGGRKQGNSDDADGRKHQHRPSSSRRGSGDGNGNRHNRRDRSEEGLADADADDADADDDSHSWHDREEGSDEGGSYAEDEPDAGFERIEEEDASGRAAEESESARPLKTTTASSRARRRRSSTATDSDSTTGEGGRPTPRREEVCGEGGGADERGDRCKDPGASATGGGGGGGEGGGGGGVHGGSGSGGSSLREDLEELRRLGDASPSSGSRALTASGNAPSSSSSCRRTSPSDPPTSRGRGDRPATPPRGVDPRFDEVGSLMSRLDAPPSLAGPERNADRRGGNEGSRSRARARPPYSNYALDEEGVRQYALSHRLPPPAAPDVAEDGGDDVASRRSARGVDPPEAGRGGDPTQIGSADPPETARGSRNAYRHSSSSSSSSGKNRKNGRGGRGRREDAPASSSSGRRRGNDNSNSNSNKGGKRNNGKEEPRSRPKSPEIKGILKKKGGHIPITQFGRPVTADDAVDDGPPPPVTSDVDEEDDENYDSFDDSGGGSDPEVTEEKSRATDCDDGTIRSHETSASASTYGTSSSARSGLRSGKYASLNAAAARKRDGDGDEDGGDAWWNRARDDRLAPVDEDGTNDDGRESRRSDLESDNGTRSGSRHAAGGRHINDADADSDDDAGSDDDDDTLRSIKSSADDRYDRSRSHFVRTADLGMTQDTIFAEQFLDDPNARPEPHYHHPSPHPPPGVQFHIDENWVCLDDGKGSYSPIAPQAVDALVAMGYRAACDPMMWTPTSKTRKYMTEKGLRFDDVPIPGPLDEGEGGPGDSTCLVWSGKFAHKYHGHEQPAVRSQGIVNMSPEELVDLLMDSGRVSEYNKSSIGRTDEVVLCDGTDPDNCPFSGQRKKKLTGVVMQGAKVIDGNAVFDSETDDEQSEHEEIEELVVFDDDGGKSVHTVTTLTKRERRRTNYLGVTKLVRTTNKPPFVRKVLEFFTLLHCRALTDDQGGDGYIIVGRGITPAASATEKKGKGVMHSEILLNVHIIRRLRGTKSRRDNGRGKGSRSSKNVTTSGRKASKGDLANRCLMINVNHLKSPMVPNMLAKKVGLSAALNFIADIRGLTE